MKCLISLLLGNNHARNVSRNVSNLCLNCENTWVHFHRKTVEKTRTHVRRTNLENAPEDGLIKSCCWRVLRLDEYFKQVKEKWFSVCLSVHMRSIYIFMYIWGVFIVILNGTSIVSKSRKILFFFKHSLVKHCVFNSPHTFKLRNSTLRGPCNQATVTYLH